MYVSELEQIADFEAFCEMAYQKHLAMQAEHDIPIGPEYCWFHHPGGWQCWECWLQGNLVAFFEAVAKGIASSLAKRSCRCGMTICPACDKCHSIHCPKSVLMGLECDEALRELSATN